MTFNPHMVMSSDLDCVNLPVPSVFRQDARFAGFVTLQDQSNCRASEQLTASGPPSKSPPVPSCLTPLSPEPAVMTESRPTNYFVHRIVIAASGSLMFRHASVDPEQCKKTTAFQEHHPEGARRGQSNCFDVPTPPPPERKNPIWQALREDP